MPPSNITALTAITLVPDVAVTVDVTGLAAPYTTWYKYVVQAGEKLISAWARPDIIVGTNNNVRFSIYLGPASAPVPYDDISQDSDLNKPKMIPLTSTGYATMTPLPAGTEMFFEAKWNLAPSPNRSLKFTAYQEVSNTIPAQSIIMSSDGQPFPLVGIGWDGVIYGFIHHANGEGGTILIGGKNAHTNKAGGKLNVYDAAHNLVVELTLSPAVASNLSYVSSDRTTTFYVNYPGNSPFTTIPGVVHVVTADGVFVKTITFPGVGVYRHAPKWDNTILYISHDNLTIRRWDLINNVYLSDLYTVPAGYTINNGILVMSDGSIILCANKPSVPFDTNITHLSPAGAVLHTWPLATGSGIGIFTYTEMCNSYDGDKLVIRLMDAAPRTRFVEYRQDGTLVRTSPDHEQFDVDGDADVAAYDGMEHWGSLNSCPVMVAMVPWTTDGIIAPVVPDLSGIYYINPANTHDKYNGDVDKKIPNPTYKTALMGE